MKTTVPESYKNYCLENESKFNEKIDFTLPQELFDFLVSESKINNMTLNCYVNYILTSKITQFIAEQEGFSFCLLSCDFELYEEDEIFELIEKHKIILIIDEKLEKKGVIMSIDEFNKFKEVENTLTALAAEQSEDK